MRATMLCADDSELPVDMAVSLVDQTGGAADGRRRDLGCERSDRYRTLPTGLRRPLAFLAGASGTTEEIVPQLLAILCSTLDFEFATAWRWVLIVTCCTVSTCGDAIPTGFESLSAASMGATVRSGDGSPGLVVRSNEPVFQSDLVRATHLKRHQAFVAEGVHAGFVFPIRTRERLVGVIGSSDEDPAKAGSTTVRCRRRRRRQAGRVHRAPRAGIRAPTARGATREVTPTSGFSAQSQSSLGRDERVSMPPSASWQTLPYRHWGTSASSTSSTPMACSIEWWQDTRPTGPVAHR